jgi:ribonuclease HI
VLCDRELGFYHRDYSRQAPELQSISRIQRERRGPLNIMSLLQTPLIGHGLLRGVDGRDLRVSDFPVISDPATSVGELLDISFVRNRVVRFRLRQGVFPYREVRAFRTLCDLLVFQYPELLARLPDPEVLVERSTGKDSWSLRRGPSGVRLLRAHGEMQVDDLGVVVSLIHAQAVARRATSRRRVHFAPHPWLCPVLPLWGSVELYAKKRLRQLIARPSLDRAFREQEARASRAAAQSPIFAAALERVAWDAIFDLADSSSRQRLTYLKVKGLRLSGWDVAAQRRGCPHCALAGSAGGDTFHIVWACPSAQSLWRMIRSWWAGLGLWAGTGSDTDRDFLTAVFSLRLPRTPSKVWNLASLSQRSALDDALEGPFPALQAVWRQLVLETLVVIVGWRHSRFDPDRAWSDTRAKAIHEASCHKVLDTLAHRRSLDARAPPVHATLITELRDLFRQGPPAPETTPLPQAEAIHLLFFDGGSRGNPGPGGSGACIVRVPRHGDQAEVLWSAAMSRAHPATTNNQAEYYGLLVGLQAAATYRWRNLEVVGDSALILRQLRDHRPPKNPRLLRFYSQVRRLADRLDVTHWTHQVRAHNRMADSLANLAMDTRTSSQVLHPSARSGHGSLHSFLSNDLAPWLADTVDRRVAFSSPLLLS